VERRGGEKKRVVNWRWIGVYVGAKFLNPNYKTHVYKKQQRGKDRRNQYWKKGRNEKELEKRTSRGTSKGRWGVK